MHYIIRLFFVSFLFLLNLSCSDDSDKNDNGSKPEKDFYLGADISWITEMESEGHRFHDTEGREQDCYVLLKSYGINVVRLRVWVNPDKHGGWCDTEDVIAKALRAEAQGMDVMVDFHYSDWWADPGKQNIPEVWREHSYEELKNDVAVHTRYVLKKLKDNGIMPLWVQVGNETSNGFLWPVGKADINPQQYAGLFTAGYNAVKEVLPDADVIVHLDNGADGGLYDWNLGLLKKYGARWDIIGMSVYPYWSMKSGKYQSADDVLQRSADNMRRLGKKYQCNVMVVETGMECADDKGNLADVRTLTESKRQLSRLIDLCKNSTEGYCKGVFYWEPECTPACIVLVPSPPTESLQ